LLGNRASAPLSKSLKRKNYPKKIEVRTQEKQRESQLSRSYQSGKNSRGTSAAVQRRCAVYLSGEITKDDLSQKEVGERLDRERGQIRKSITERNQGDNTHSELQKHAGTPGILEKMAGNSNSGRKLASKEAKTDNGSDGKTRPPHSFYTTVWPSKLRRTAQA